MKAMVYHQYGSPDSLELADVDMPSVQEGEVLVKLHAASVNWLDWHFLEGSPLMTRLMAGLLRPKNCILGIDLAGQVVDIGGKVARFQIGDEVFGSTTHGCFAEYVAVNEGEIELKPSEMPFDEAAGIGAAASTALHGLRDAGMIKSDDRVLINGASGGVGTYAVQIGKACGAEVTGTSSAGNIDLVRSLGADNAIDHAHKDFTQTGDRYNLIFDCVAAKTYDSCKGALDVGGRYVTTKFSPGLALQAWWKSIGGERKFVPLMPRPPDREDLDYLRNLAETRRLRTVVDRRYSLSEIPDALRYLELGHARGKIIIAM